MDSDSPANGQAFFLEEAIKTDEHSMQWPPSSKTKGAPRIEVKTTDYAPTII